MYFLVVPLAGTWIETINVPLYISSQIVVPLAGTWIETPADTAGRSRGLQSFPLRERGLKHDNSYASEKIDWSFPLRERGLKHHRDIR